LDPSLRQNIIDRLSNQVGTLRPDLSTFNIRAAWATQFVDGPCLFIRNEALAGRSTHRNMLAKYTALLTATQRTRLNTYLAGG